MGAVSGPLSSLGASPQRLHLVERHAGTGERLVGGLEPGRGVHGIAERGVLDAAFPAEVPDHRLAEMEADAGLADRRQAGVQRPQRLARRPAESVTLVAVSKTRSAEEIEALLK